MDSEIFLFDCFSYPQKFISIFSTHQLNLNDGKGRPYINFFAVLLKEIYSIKVVLTWQLYPNSMHTDYCRISFSLSFFIYFINLSFWHFVQSAAERRRNMTACKSLPKHHPHFIIAHFYVNKQHDSLITQSMSSCISCLVFSITLGTNCHRFLPSAQAYYQDSYFCGRGKK